MKLTDELLTQLINEDLQRIEEDTYDLAKVSQIQSPKDPKQSLFSKALAGPLSDEDLKALAATTADNNTVETDDFEKYFQNPEENSELDYSKARLALVRVINLIQKAKDADLEVYSANSELLDNILQKAVQTQTASARPIDPKAREDDLSISQAPLELSTPGQSGISGLPAEFATAFSVAFAHERTMQGRLEALAETGAAVSKGKRPPGDTGQAMASLIVLDAVSRILRSISSGQAAGWMIEAFYGVLMGGTDIGASMGAGDFSIGGLIDASGAKEGSAKLYESNQTTFGKQAVKNFLHYKEGDFARYVFSEKVSTGGKRTGGLNFVTLNIFIGDLRRVKATPGLSSRSYSTRKHSKSLKEEFELTIFDGKSFKPAPLKIEYTGANNNAQFSFDKSYWRATPISITIPTLEGYAKNFNSSFSAINKEVEEMFKLATLARKNMDIYVQGGDYSNGLSSVDYLVKLVNKVNVAYTSISGETGVKPEISGAEELSTKVTENQNLTQQTLDKLIERVILYRQ